MLCPAFTHDNKFNCVFFCVSLAPGWVVLSKI